MTPDLQKAYDQGMALSILCTAKANKADPEFSAKAKKAILAHLDAVESASGEELVHVAKAHGAIPANGDKAFGGIFRSLSMAGEIRTIGFCLRARGHGTSGGRIWMRESTFRMKNSV